MFCKKASLCVLLNLLFIHHSIAIEEIGKRVNNFTEKNENVSLSNNVTQTTKQPTAVEVDDLLHGGEFKNLTHHETLISYLVDDESFKNNGKWDIELIEDGSNTEDDRIKYFANAFNAFQNSSEGYELVTILVISVIILVIAGYAGYYSWRKFGNRGKKRQVLVNEIDPDDIRNFSI